MISDDRYRFTVDGLEDVVGRERQALVGIDDTLAEAAGLVIMDVQPGWVAMDAAAADELGMRLLTVAEELRQQRRQRSA